MSLMSIYSRKIPDSVKDAIVRFDNGVGHRRFSMDGEPLTDRHPNEEFWLVVGRGNDTAIFYMVGEAVRVDQR